MTLLSSWYRHREIRKGTHGTWAPNERRVEKISNFQPSCRISDTVQDRTKFTMTD